MDFEDDPIPAAPGPRIGRDELNLAEFPFALLATRPGKSQEQRLVFQDGAKEWVVEGSSTYGLPNAVDVQVYVVLMEITKEQGFPAGVYFNRSNIVKRLGWVHSGASYERLILSLDRLVGVTIRTKNAFYDARQRRWTTQEAFHILESYKIADLSQPNAHQTSLFPSWIRWSQELYANMQAGYIKSLDVDLFLSLRSSISQALYRYLDAKRYDGKPCYRIGLKKLAFEHLGMSRSYYASDIKRKLRPAHEELIECGFLAGAEYAPMKSGEEMVVFQFPTRAAREAAKPLPETEDPLLARLQEAGVSRVTAASLLGTSAEECARQLDFLPYRDARDPGAVLVKSIREAWAAPPGWLQAQERRRAEEEERRRRTEAVERQVKQSAAEAEFEAFWAALPVERREELEAAAMRELRRENRVVAEFATKHPDSPVYRGAVRPLLKKLSGWKAS
ncbi:MAG: replication initiator protein A [Armatimonadota bacterium]